MSTTPYIFEDGKILTAEQLNDLQNPTYYKSNGYIYHDSLSFEKGNVLTADELNKLQSQISIANNYYVHASSTPKSQGVVNALKRAKQLTDVVWKCNGYIHGVIYSNGAWSDQPFIDGRIYRGVIYSGQQATNWHYTGLQGNLDTFVTSTCNPNSVLYTKNNTSMAKGGAYYGTVCSKFASYVYDMKIAYSTSAMGTVTGVTLKATAGKWTAEDVELLDMVVDLDSHTAVITDILYDENGKICFIEISEAMPPTCRRWLWDMETFKKKWIDYYNLYNYAYLDRIPYEQNQYVNVDDETGAVVIRNYIIMPEYGDKFNYTPSSTKQICHILDTNHSYTKAIVKLDGNIIDTIAIDNTTSSFNFSVAKIGYLEMYLEDDSGNKSHSVYGCVVKASVSVIDSSEFNQGKLTISYEGSSGKPIFASWGAKSMGECIMLDRENDRAIILDENSATLLFSSGSTKIAVAYENEYGIYFSSNTTFTPKEVGTDENESNNDLLSKGSYWNGYSVSSTNGTMSTNNDGDWTYKKVPVEGNVKYSISGASFVYFYDYAGKNLSGLDLNGLSNFTSHEKASFMTITYDSTNSTVFNETFARVEAVGAVSDVLLSSTTATLHENANLSSSSYGTPAKQDGYFTYVNIPVESSTTYYASGATRSYYLDSNKTVISTANLKEETIPFKFTTPSNASYISISFAADAFKLDANTVRLIQY